MFNRLTLLRAATALLYLGPLLAGLAGFGWSLVPIFTLLFLVWLMVIRPETWPQRDSEWLTAQPWVALFARAAVQLLLVILCFGIGRGIGGVMGYFAIIPFWLPVFISAGSIVIGRIFWTSDKNEEDDHFHHDALRQMGAVPLADRPKEDWPGPFRSLLALPSEATDREIDDALISAIGTEQSGPNLRALARHLRFAEGGKNGLRRGVIRLATDPASADLFKGSSAVTEALFVAGLDPALLTDFLSRARALYADRPDLWHDYPAGETLRFVADSVRDAAAAENLRAFAEVMEAGSPDR